MTEQKPKRVKMPRRPFTGITPIHERFLVGTPELPYAGIVHLHMLRADQFCRLYCSMNSVKHVQCLLKELVDNHYLAKEAPPTTATRSKYVYVIGEAGIAYAKERGYDSKDSLRASEELGKSYTHITHLLELNDVLICAMRLEEKQPLYHLDRLIHDRELKRNPCKVVWRGKRLDVIPDAFLDFHITRENGSKRRMPIVAEHDRATEFGEGFRKKVRGLIALVKSEAYKTRFGVNSITIAFTTFNGEKRRDKMREVVRQELGSDIKTLGHLFMFTAQVQPLKPEHMLLDRCWYTSIDDKPVAILGE